MAEIVKKLSVITGRRLNAQGEFKDEYVELGTMIKFDTKAGGAFYKVAIPAHLLNPQMAALALKCTAKKDPAMAESGQVMALVQDINHQPREPGRFAPAGPPAASAAAPAEDDEIPF